MQNRINGMRPCVARYWDFVNEVKAAQVKLFAGAKVVFYIQMPKSWSAKRKAETDGKPHLSRPDLSNLIKALEDAVHGEDSHIWKYALLEKRWAHEGAILIINECEK